MSETYDDVIRRIKEERLRLGLSQKEIAQFVHTTQSNVNKMEQGARRLNYGELKYICESPIDMQYAFTGNKCGERYKEFFSHYRYEQLLNIMNIIVATGIEVQKCNMSDCWRMLFMNAEVLRCKEKKKNFDLNMFSLIRRIKDFRQMEMAKRIGIDVKKLRDLENARSLPDSELIWQMYNLFSVSPAIMLRDKNCLVNEICYVLEDLDEEVQIKILSIIEANFVV